MDELTYEEKLIELRRFVTKGIHEGRLRGGPEELINSRVFAVALCALDSSSSHRTREALSNLLSCFELTKKDWTPKDSPE